MKSSRVSRVVQMLTTLQAGKGYAVGDLSRIFGISRRTLFRDLKELQNIGVQYRYNGRTSGYSLAPEFFLPPINLNLQEALSLLLLVHKVRSEVQLPFKTSALVAALKIESNLPPRVRRYCEQALRNISTRASPQAATQLLDSRFSKVQQALAERRKVRMVYESLFDGGMITCEVCPYHLLYNQRAWYVVGWSSMHKAVRTFKLNRIKELDVVDEQFADGGKFDLSEYLGRAWSMIPEGRIYDVRLRFLPKVASNVAEVQWHSTQKTTRNQDGSATLEFRVDGIGEIGWWILGYGDQVEVVAPSILRKRIVEAAKGVIKLNEGA